MSKKTGNFKKLFDIKVNSDECVTQTISEGQRIILPNNVAIVSASEDANGNLTLTLSNGSVFTIQHYAQVAAESQQAIIVGQNGKAIDINPYLSSELASNSAAKLAAIQPAAGGEEEICVENVKIGVAELQQSKPKPVVAEAKELSEIMPAAGGDAGGGPAGGFGFQSVFQQTDFTGQNQVGGIAGTASTFGLVGATQTNAANIVANLVADAPTLATDPSYTIHENGHAQINISATLADSREYLTVTMSNIGTGWTVDTSASGGTYDAATHTWTITLPVGQNFNGGPILTPPLNSDVDLTGIVVSATSTTQTGQSATITLPTQIIVLDVTPGVPLLATDPSYTIAENGHVQMNIDAKLTDNREALTVKVTGIGAGWTVDTSASGGTYDAATHTWTITLPNGQNFNGGPILTPPLNSDVDLTGVKVIATSTTVDGYSASTDLPTQVIVQDVTPGIPLLSTDPSYTIAENDTVQMDIDAKLTDSREILTVTVTGIAAGWTVDTTTSGGTYNAATGTWTITLPKGQNFLGGPKLTPPLNSDVDMTGIKVTATSTTVDGYSISTDKPTQVIVQDVTPGMPILATDPSYTIAENGHAELKIDAKLTDIREFLTVKVTGIGAGWTVDTSKSGGTYDAATGTWTIKLPIGQNFNGGPTLTPPLNSDDDLSGIKVSATSTTVDHATATTTLPTEVIVIDNTPGKPILATDPSYTIAENGHAQLNIDAKLTDMRETLTVKVTGIGTGWTVDTSTSGGTYNAATGTWTITLPKGTNFNGGPILTPPLNSDVDLNGIKVTATSTTVDGYSASTDLPTQVVVIDNTPGMPILATDPSYTINENGHAQMHIDAKLTDNRETLTVKVTGIGAGWTVDTSASGGTYNAATGTWTITLPKGSNFNGGPILTPPLNSDADLTGVKVTATSTTDDGYSTSTNLPTQVIVIDSTPGIPLLNTDPSYTINENGHAQMNIDAKLTDNRETLTVKVTGIGAGWTVDTSASGGTYNAATGTWTITLPKGSNFNGGPVLTPPLNSGADLTGIKVIATSTTVDGYSASTDKPTQVTVIDTPNAPTLVTDPSYTISENGHAQLNISAKLTDLTEKLTVTITGIGPGWTVDTTSSGGTYNAATGTWTVTLPTGQHFTGGPILTPPLNSDADLSGIKVTATSTTPDGHTASVDKPTQVIVIDNNPGMPLLSTDPSYTISENGHAKLNIDAKLTDAREILTVKVTGIGAGWTVDTSASGGTYNAATGTWTITLPKGQNFNGGPILTPPLNSDADLNGIKVTATSTTVDGYSTSKDLPTQVIVIDDHPGAPLLNTDASYTISENGHAKLNIDAKLTDVRETLTVKVTGIGAGWTVDTSTSGGTYNAATGTWTITLGKGQNFLGGPILTPPLNSDVDLTGVKVTATSTTVDGYSASTEKPTQVIVIDDHPGTPILTTDPSYTIEENGHAVLQIDAKLTDTRETLTVKVTGIGAGWTVDTGASGGTYNAATGTWTITLPKGQNFLGGPILTPPLNSDADLTGIKVTATSTTADGYSASTEKPTQVIVLDDTAGAPILTTDSSYTIAENGHAQMHIDAKLTDNREILTVKVTGIGAGWTVDTSTSGGTYNAATGTWTITLPKGTNFNGGPILTPPLNSDVDMTGVKVIATSTTVDGASASTQLPTQVIVIDNNPGMPILATDPSYTINENGHAQMDISAKLTDVREILTVKVTGIGAGWTVDTTTSGGTYNAATGTWTITLPKGQNFLGGPILTPPLNSDADLTGIKVTATSTTVDGYSISTQLPTQVIVVDGPNVPLLAVNESQTISENGHAPLQIDAKLTDPTEKLTITVTGIAPGWTVDTSTSGGTYNAATGTWTITLPTGQNFKGGPILTPPLNSDVDLTGIKVTATSTTPDGHSASIDKPTQIIVIDDIAGAPILATDPSYTIAENGHAQLHIDAKLTDTREILTVKVTGIGAGWTVDTSTSGGTYNAATGTWTITMPKGTNFNGGPILTPPLNSDVDLNGIKVTATSTTVDGASASTQLPTQVIVIDNNPGVPLLNTDPSYTIPENGHAKLNIDAKLTDVRETLTVKVTGIGAGWTVDTSTSGGTYNAATGTWTITLAKGQNFLGGPTLTPPLNSDADLSGIKVIATSTTVDGYSASTEKPTQVIVSDSADAPTLTTDPSYTIAENGHAQLHIDAKLTDTSETLTVKVTGIGAGWTVDTSTSGGTYNAATGTWTITLPKGQNFNGGPILTPPLNSDADLSGIKVIATSTTADGATASVDKPTQVIVIDNTPGVPLLSTDPSYTISENGHAKLNIDAKLTDARETLTVKVTGIGAGWTVDTSTSGGTYNAATGTWTITLPKGSNFAGGPTLTPPLNSDVDLTGIKVTATSTTVDGYSASKDLPTQVIVIDSTPGVPLLSTDPSYTISENGHAQLNIDAKLTDARETLTVKVTGIGAGWTVDTSTSGGTYNAATGTWTITLPKGSNFAGGPTLTPPLNSDADLTGIKVIATSTTVDGYSASAEKPTQVIVIDGADAPTLTTDPSYTIAENGHAQLNINAKLTDTSETLTVKVTGIGAGWTVDTSTSGGTYNAATGTWTITLPKGQNFTGGPILTPPLNSDVDLTGIKVTATSTSVDGGTASVDKPTQVIVIDNNPGVPLLNTDPSYTIEENGHAKLNIDAKLTDAREILTVKVTGIGAGWTVDTSTSGGTYNAATGTWTITLGKGQNFNGGPILTPPLNSDVDLNGIKVTATSTTVDGYSASTEKPTQVIVIDNHPGAPLLTTDASYTIDENTSVQMNINAKLTDAREILTVTVTGIGAGWGVNTSASGGTYNAATGTWTITLPKGTNFAGGPILTPPLNSDADLTGVKVTATSTTVDGYSASTQLPTQVIVTDNPANAPILNTDPSYTISENGHAQLNIDAKLTDTRETLTVKITGIGAGWTVDTSTSGGTYNAATGTWTITMPKGTNFNGGPILTPPLNSDVDLSGIKVSATSTTGAGLSATTEKPTQVIVIDDHPGTPLLTTDASYTIQENTSVQMNINAKLTDVREILTVTVTGIGAGWSVNTSASGGTYNAATGTWTITLAKGQNFNGGPILTPPLNSDADLTGIKVTATSTTVDGYSAHAQLPTQVIVLEAADAPVLTVAGSHDVYEDGATALMIDAKLVNANETLTVKVTGIAAGWTVDTSVSGGTYNAATGTWSITLAKGQSFHGGPTLKPPANSDVDLTGLVITATGTLSNGNSSSATANTSVIVDAVADGTTVTASVPNPSYGGNIHYLNPADKTQVAINVGAQLKDTDGSEVITKIVIDLNQLISDPKGGMTTLDQLGFILNKGVEVSPGVWEIQVNGQNASTALNGLVLIANGSQALTNPYHDAKTHDVAIKIQVYSQEQNLSGGELTTGNNTAVDTVSVNLKFMYTPLVLDLDGNGVELISSDHGVMFDMNNDGVKDKTTWVKGSDGLLALDLNGDGVINNQSELFGNSNDKNSGFANLAQYDSNKDGKIDANDAIYSKLTVWQDLNGDGISQANEMHTLAELGISSIGLSSSQLNQTAADGMLWLEGSFTYSNGTSGKIVDALFSVTDGKSLQGSVVKGTAGNDTLTGTAKNDVIVGNGGHDVATGGAGADRFVLNDHGVMTIKDFSIAQGDTLDLSHALQNLPSGAQLTNYLNVVQENGKTMVQVDTTGEGTHFKTVAVLDGVATTLDDLVSHGSVVYTKGADAASHTTSTQTLDIADVLATTDPLAAHFTTNTLSSPIAAANTTSAAPQLYDPVNIDVDMAKNTHQS